MGIAQISLDGLTPEVHVKFHGIEGSWLAAVTAIEDCIDENLRVCISTTVTRNNQSEISEMIDFAKDFGISWYMLYNFIPTGGGASAASPDLSPEERREVLEKALQANGRGMQVLSTAPQYAPVARSLSKNNCTMVRTHFYNPTYANEKMSRLANFIGGCGAGRFYLAIEPKGDIYPCVFLPHDPNLNLGNLLENDLQYIWRNNDVLWLLRDKHMLKGHCPQCENRFICGDCRARA